jgi:hypothetical protein
MSKLLQFKQRTGVYTLVFHRILDFKAGWISIRPYFFKFYLPTASLS